ncbi:NAD(+)/NADH kinase [Psychrilyobacter atlanticus]|uniref:NAD(+)/NADH kinase n=1 Tax=Psychrilyobacter atlanticus TaxID=271091 RepID=UPI00040AE274|nr:NAD(+)/NADH kinase [Psychrilyobacter atlanticus]
MMKKVCIVYNENKKEALGFYEKTVAYFKKNGVTVCPIEEVKSCDFAVVIGGDGTLLRAGKKLIVNSDIFVIAVNMGNLGFLTEIKVQEAFEIYEQVLKGDYELEERRVMEITMGTKTLSAINEVVISKGGLLTKLVKIGVYSNGDLMNTFRADGVIIATPTGSTGYSLSAGGPIIKPTLNAMVVTPIAPHNLSLRPVVIDGTEELVCSIKDLDGEGYLTVDGEQICKISPENKIKIKYSDKTLKLVLPKNRDYYDILREKLKWGNKLY